jgi:hypothetical protein
VDADVADLDRLPTEELRRLAFRRAEHRGDVAFFWDLVRHLPGASELAREDASAGNITGSITETVRVVRELFGGAALGEAEPLLRARFIDYLTEHGLPESTT